MALLAVAGGFTALVLGALIERRAWLETRWGVGWWVHVAGLAVATGMAAAAVLARIRRWRTGEWSDLSFAPFRLAFVSLVVAAAVQMIWLQPFRLLHAAVCLGYGAGVFALLVLFGPALARRMPRRSLRVLDFVVFNACLAPVVAEVALRGWNELHPNPLLDTAAVAGDTAIESRAEPAGSLRLGFRVNADGFFDRDVAREPRSEHLVVCIGDSFSVGIVPHHRHYTTLCEREFEGLEVYNVGVSGAGPPAYRRMLERFAAPLDPDLIVIALFVGNDVVWPGQERATHAFDAWLDRDALLVYQVPRRLARLAEARRDGATLGDPSRWNENLGYPLDQVLTIEQIESRMPWLDDPAGEPPSFSETSFLDIERLRARSACDPARSDYSFVFESLTQILAAAGEVPVAVLLLPDEFQVEDELWERVLAPPRTEELDRDLPQHRLSSWLTERGISFVDLLPRLRALDPLPDGRIHAYHSCDTHFNARGNAAAAEGLAELVARSLGLPRRRPDERGTGD